MTGRHISNQSNERQTHEHSVSSSHSAITSIESIGIAKLGCLLSPPRERLLASQDLTRKSKPYSREGPVWQRRKNAFPSGTLKVFLLPSQFPLKNLQFVVTYGEALMECSIGLVIIRWTNFRWVINNSHQTFPWITPKLFTISVRCKGAKCTGMKGD